MQNKTNEQIERKKKDVELRPMPISQPPKPAPIPDKKPLKPGQTILTDSNGK